MDGGDRSDAHRRVLTALEAMSHGGDGTLAEFAAAVLRRVDDSELAGTDPGAVARWLADTFTRIAAAADDGAVRIHRPATGLDGRRPGPTTVEVTTSDRPFLMSTITDDLERAGHRITRSWHPIIGVSRDAEGHVDGILPARHADDRVVVLHLELDSRFDERDAERLTEHLEELVADVIKTTDDFDKMRDRIVELSTELRFGTWTEADAHEADEVAELLEWALDDNLILLGVREYEVSTDDDPVVQVVVGSGLGLLRDESTSRFADGVRIDDLPDELQRQLHSGELLTVTRTRRAATVQRRERMQVIGLTRRDSDGRPLHEVRILALFTRKALAEPVGATPVLRRKLRTILEREDVVDGSHDEATLTSLFQALPKDELFQADADQLHTLLVGLLHAEQHGETRTLVREDPRTGSVSVVVAVPRDRYGPWLRQRIQDHLAQRYQPVRTDVELSLGDSHEALLRFLLHLDGPIPDIATTELRTEIRDLARSWLDELLAHIDDDTSDPARSETLGRIAARLPAGYRDTVGVADALADVLLVDRLATTETSMVVELRTGPSEPLVRVRAARRGETLELSAFMPVLESLGLTVVEELPHRLTSPGDAIHLHDFGVRARSLDPERDGERIAAAILAAWNGHLIVDGMNALVLVAGLPWRDVSVLRAYRRLRRQLGTTFSSEYVNQTMVANPDVVGSLVTYFHARFDPELDADPEAQQAARDKALAACDRLERLDHDRILRGVLELIDATLRTNAFLAEAVADGTDEPYLAFKFDPSQVSDVAAPAPYREIFVHSPRVEGIHQRYGPVARGGLRWSDRRDDVRAEVFDLVKAQVLKNTLIVPTGAKGGFVVTREPDDPTALRDEVRRQYVTFVRGLLDLTDNLDGDRVVTRPGVRRHDGDDPYLVVAADRGTATLSDTANEVARRYDYWLGDAFASGGSNGYDHKALGVTAAGAWLSVRRHFRELGIDVQTEPVRVVGIGDMSGDVFGNGMLQSQAIKLVAAFDHRDIFVDPDPDPERSWQERRRLFTLPRSSWQDYDHAVLSTGGGVYPRAARQIELSAQAREALRIDSDVVTPPELIRAILRAPVDLLFAGGIGTYVKASTERDDDLGDRANDELRVDADEVRARVISEGANLAITQRGRIEYARRGGHCNQDAIDNAAGVATSDVEVNLKILLSAATSQGLLTLAERDTLLADLADDVVALVMRTVDRQSAGLAREALRSPTRLNAYDRMMDRLAESHGLDRDVEMLPRRRVLRARAEAGGGLTRPELATLTAWAKRELKEQLLGDPLLDTPLLLDAIDDQFPAAVVDQFRAFLPGHRLRRELTATALANDVVDRMGVTFVGELAPTTGGSPAEVTLAYRIAREVLDATDLWRCLDALELSRDVSWVRELESEVERPLTAVTVGLIDHPKLRDDPRGLLGQLTKVTDGLRDTLVGLGTPDQRRARTAHMRWLIDDLVDEELARLLAMARELMLLPEVADVVGVVDGAQDPARVMETMLLLGDGLGIGRLEDLLGRVTPAEGWTRRQHDGISVELRHTRRDAALQALCDRDAPDHLTAVERFLARHADGIARLERLLGELQGGDGPTLDGVAVAARALRAVVDRDRRWSR